MSGGSIAKMRARINAQRKRTGEKQLVKKCCKMAIPGIHSGNCPTRKKMTSPSIPELPALNRQEGGSHYKEMAIQPVEFIHKNKIPFIEGCVIKYCSRWRQKGGIGDLKKARHFIDLLIEMETGNDAQQA